MYAVTGITGKVGGALARTLLASGQSVRAVVRDVTRGQSGIEHGCEVISAEMDDATALSAAFACADGVFILPPSQFDPAPGFPEARAVINAVKTAIESAHPGKVVCLSTIGAQATQSNLLTQRTLMENALGKVPIPVAFLRPGWFMENALWDVASARDQGVILSFLQPLDKTVPMVATADVGRIAAQLLRETWNGKRVVERETRGGTRGTATRQPERHRGGIRQDSRASRTRRDRPTRNVGHIVLCTGDERSNAAYPDARWIQRRLDRLRR
jgi:uncharacterized protein YbjT (DUF2867 family)